MDNFGEDKIVPRETIFFMTEGEGQNILTNVPRETINKLQTYEMLLKKWNRSINLVSAKKDFWQRHILDSAQLFSFISNKDIVALDLGSGGGLPAIVLSILGVQEIHCIESDRRKCIFLKEASRELDINLIIHEGRVEDIIIDITPSLITARAFTALPNLLNYVSRWMTADAFCLFPKGKNWRIEVQEACETWLFSCVEHQSATSPESAILEIRHLKQIGPL